MEFTNLVKNSDQRTYTFTLSPIHVSYANTLRRLILTGVETVSFRADMSSSGTTTDVVVKRNDTPMTNEMLAARIGLLPVHVTEPLKWKDTDYQFILRVEGDAEHTRHVTASDFQVVRLSGAPDSNGVYDEKEETTVATDTFFPPHPLTRQTCLLATLQPGSGSVQQKIEIIAKATRGTGREHARFSPVSQCSYEYSLDNDPERIDTMFKSWLEHAKKASGLEKGSARYSELEREFRTMQIKRCYLKDDKGEPFSFDFTVESVGVLSVDYIIQRACEVGENMCSLYVNIDKGKLPSEITISHANCRLIGYDFLFRGHDHTLGNLFQTWLVQNHIEGNAQPKITYAGFSVPHPLRDEMVLRIGVEDGEESTARAAVAAAARGCVELFQSLKRAWLRDIGAPVELRPSVGRRLTSARSVAPASSVPASSASSASASSVATPVIGLKKRPVIPKKSVAAPAAAPAPSS